MLLEPSASSLKSRGTWWYAVIGLAVVVTMTNLNRASTAFG